MLVEAVSAIVAVLFSQECFLFPYRTNRATIAMLLYKINKYRLLLLQAPLLYFLRFLYLEILYLTHKPFQKDLIVVLAMSTSLAVATYTTILQATATANPSGLPQSSKLGIGIGLGLALGLGIPVGLITLYQACCRAGRNTRQQISQSGSV
jgi:hypothetical protein